jgi:N-methylhydantoinase A
MDEVSVGKICIGVDVGGTFTDAVLTDGVRTWRAKSPTTPRALGQGVLAAVRLASERSGRTLEELVPDVSRFGLGTTAVTNTLASRSGRRVGLLTTAGFEGMLPFAQGSRIVDVDGWLSPPEEVVSRRAIAPIRERIDREGRIIHALSTAEVREQAHRLVREERIEAIAVSYLWSFINPVHESETIEAIEKIYPDLPVVAGSALHPAIREYERTTHAVLNAYVSGSLSGIEELEAELDHLGLKVPLLLVHSAGGSITVGEARRQPISLAVSGPAAGVAASIEVADACQVRDFITCDMGGTSFDVSVVTNGEPMRRSRGEVMGVWTALSLLDVESIGAGGGSTGWIDARGMLRVGPRSAGADPGPACYGRGGTEASVTDALVVLGFIDPSHFLGGDFSLDFDAAQASCARLGEPLGLSAEDTAWGIRQIALADMVKATRGRLAAFGLDPRNHTLLSFGGSGALFTADIAAALGVEQVLVPELASVLSAFGAATTDVRRERIRSVLAIMPVDASLVEKILSELASSVENDLAADGVQPAERSVSFEADMRFSKQISELQLPIRSTPASPTGAAAVLDGQLLVDFNAEYIKRYGQGSVVLGAPVELVSLRAIGIGKTVQAKLNERDREEAAAAGRAVSTGSRRVRIARGPSGVRDVPVFRGDDLRPGYTLQGPSLVDGADTTIWLPEGSQASVDRHGTLAIEVTR